LELRNQFLTATSDCHPGTASEVEVRTDGVRQLETTVRNTVANDLWHPRLLAVPVHLEAVWISHIQIIGSDEVEYLSILIGADTGDNEGPKTAAAIWNALLGGLDFEAVGGVCDSHF